MQQIRRPPDQHPDEEYSAGRRNELDKELAEKIVKTCEGDLRIMERRLEEIKDGREPTNLLMSDETLTTVANMKVDRVREISVQQREK